QNVHRQTIDVWDQPRPDAVGKRAVAIGRQVTKICFCDLRANGRSSTNCQRADAPDPREKLAPREFKRGGIIGVLVRHGKSSEWRAAPWSIYASLTLTDA